MAGWIDVLRKTLGWLCGGPLTPTVPGIEFTLPSSEVRYVIPDSLMQFTLREED